MTSSNHHPKKSQSPSTSNKKADLKNHDALDNTPTLAADVLDEITGHEPTLEMPHTVRSRSGNHA